MCALYVKSDETMKHMPELGVSAHTWLFHTASLHSWVGFLAAYFLTFGAPCPTQLPRPSAACDSATLCPKWSVGVVLGEVGTILVGSKGVSGSTTTRSSEK